MFKFTLLAALVAFSFAVDIPFEVCGGGWPGTINIEIPQCIQHPCDFNVGDTVDLNIKIAIGGAVSELRTRLTSITENFREDYQLPMPNSDA